jgi:predicted permease
MKRIKQRNLLKLIFMPAFMFASPVSANAESFGISNPKTGDTGIIGIIIAVAAFIATAFITTKLTKRKNKRR